MRRFVILASLFSFANSAIADPELDYLVSEMRCDRALEMILDSQSGQAVWLNESEAAALSGFLLGFGLLSAIGTPESPMRARGAAIGGLLAVCRDEPSRSILELAIRHFR